MESKAEEYKNKGNNEFKKGNYREAIDLYTQALSKPNHLSHIHVLDIKENEAIYTNRAISYIYLKDFEKALDDCYSALRLNPNFGKAYKRLSKVFFNLGNLEVSPHDSLF